MIKTEALTKYYGDILGVKDISLEIKKGEIFGLLGPNGAGKSTFINCVMQMINRTSGSIYINGKEILPRDCKYKLEVGYLPSEIHLYDDLKVADMIQYSAGFYEGDLTERIKSLLDKLKVPVEKKIEDLSYGNLKKVGIVLAMMHSPEILILDEPTSGLDPLVTEDFFKLLEEEKKKGTTILFSTHILSEVKKLCDRIGIIKNGELIKISDVSSLVDDSFSIVTVVGTEYKKMRLPIKDIVIKEENKKSIKFIYKGNINDLIQVLSAVKIEHLTVEEPDIEDIFMTYYR